MSDQAGHGKKVVFTKAEEKILQVLQGDIPLHSQPFAKLGKDLNLTEEAVIEIIQELSNRGIIRKIGAVLRHREAGYLQNAMVVWSIPEFQVETAARVLASFSEVSHCYERQPPFEERYNVFTMVHVKKGEISSRVKAMAEAANLDDYQILVSETEHKKSSMVYFKDSME